MTVSKSVNLSATFSPTANFKCVPKTCNLKENTGGTVTLGKLSFKKPMESFSGQTGTLQCNRDHFIMTEQSKQILRNSEVVVCKYIDGEPTWVAKSSEMPVKCSVECQNDDECHNGQTCYHNRSFQCHIFDNFIEFAYWKFAGVFHASALSQDYQNSS